MAIRSLILAITVVAAGTGFALAQSAPAPANQSGGGVSATTPAPTDPSTAGESGNTKGTPARRATNARPGTTGMGATNPGPASNAKETQDKNVSPASPVEGTQKEK